MTKPMTAKQTALLASIKKQFGTKKARGIIPAWAVDCYDYRVFRGLMDRGLIGLLTDADHSFRFVLRA